MLDTSYSTIIGAVIGAAIGSILSFILGLVMFNKQLSKETNFLWLQKIEKIIFFIGKLIHELEITLKSSKDFFLNPDPYYQRNHPQGIYFEDRDYSYKKQNNNQLLDVDFYINFQNLKLFMQIYTPNFNDQVINLENKIIEVNPMLHEA